MIQVPSETTALVHTCNVSDCDKTNKRKKGLTLRLANVHQLLVNNVLSPLVTSARTLFGGNNVADDISIQGNSEGEINFPIVVSSGTLLCGVCDEPFTNKEDVTNHMNNDHEDEDEALSGTKNDNASNELTDNAHNEFNDEDEEGLVDIMEEQELYEALNTLTQSVDDPEKVIQLQEKLKRYQKIMEQKNLIRESLLEELKIAKHNSTLMAQVEVNKAKELNKKRQSQRKTFQRSKTCKRKDKREGSNDKAS